MVSPFVCAVCRAKYFCLLPRRVPRTRIIRLLPHAASRQKSTWCPVPEDATRRQPDGRGSGRKSGNGNGKENDSPRGRYSGKILTPEELLHQLEVRPGARKTINAHDDHTVLPPALTEKARLLIKAVDAGNLSRVENALNILAQDCSQLHPLEIRTLLNAVPVLPALIRYGMASTRAWLDVLVSGQQPQAHGSTEPTPVSFLRSLANARLEKTFLSRLVLERVAYGLAELRFSQPNHPSLRRALLELTEIWRMCLFSFATRKQRNAQRSDRSQETSDSSVILTAENWDFLPQLTKDISLPQEQQTEATFEEILSRLLPEGRTPDGHNPDYATPAIITLDLMNSVEAPPLGSTRGAPDMPNHPRSSQSMANLAEFSTLAEFLRGLLRRCPAPRITIRLRERITGRRPGPWSEHYRSMAQRMGLDMGSIAEPNQDGLNMPTTSRATKSSPTPAGRAQALTGRTPPNSTNQAEVDPPDPLQSNNVDYFAVRTVTALARAVERQDLYSAQRLREQIYAFSGAQTTPTALPVDVYEHLMMTFLSLRDLQSAMEIWSHVIQLGYKPTVKTYTVMMRGSQTARDISGMEAFWSKMRQSGLQPDLYAWSTRVAGLLKRDWAVPAGMQALTEMSREWFAAARAHYLRGMSAAQKQRAAASNDLASQLLNHFPESVDGVPRPNLVIMNSAIGTLATSDDRWIPKVLAWGRTFKLEPDGITYNSLLNIALRHKKIDDALNILKRMQERDIQANSTTWNILLATMFTNRFLEGLDPVQQQEKIIDFLQSVEDKGSALDEKGYSMIINRLLKHHSNPTAAAMVLDHMAKKGLEPNVHIYTMLMSYHFTRKPTPDLASIQALWEQMSRMNNGYGVAADTNFYDRMIEGYAQHHRLAGLQPALTFLQRAKEGGQKPGWRALESVARALAERQEWSRLRALVEDVRRGLQDTRGAVQAMGQKEFWWFIIEMGLLREENITNPEQLLPTTVRLSPLLQVEEEATANHKGLH